MSAAPNAVRDTPQDDWIRRHRLNVDEYYRMGEVGLLAPDLRTELIEGEIIDMAPIGVSHAALVGKLVRHFFAMVGNQALVEGQRPIRLSNISEPQPDVVLLRPRADEYTTAHPTANDVLLLIEVSDSTLRYDRERKLPLYAQHGIPEVWLIDVQQRRLLRFTEPSAGLYQKSETFESGFIQPRLLANIGIDLDKLLAL